MCCVCMFSGRKLESMRSEESSDLMSIFRLLHLKKKKKKRNSEFHECLVLFVSFLISG